MQRLSSLVRFRKHTPRREGVGSAYKAFATPKPKLCFASFSPTKRDYFFVLLPNFCQADVWSTDGAQLLEADPRGNANRSGSWCAVTHTSIFAIAQSIDFGKALVTERTVKAEGSQTCEEEGWKRGGAERSRKGFVLCCREVKPRACSYSLSIQMHLIRYNWAIFDVAITNNPQQKVEPRLLNLQKTSFYRDTSCITAGWSEKK